MTGKVYKTAQGTQLNIDHLRLLNEGVVAVGNMRVNARGDEVNPDGSIKQTRTDIMRKNYRLNAPLIKTQPDALAAATQTTATPTKVAQEHVRPARTTSIARTPRTTESTTQASSVDSGKVSVQEVAQVTNTATNTPTSSESLRGSLANLIINAPYRPGEEIVEEEPEITEEPNSEVSDLFSTSEPTQRTITRI